MRLRDTPHKQRQAAAAQQTAQMLHQRNIVRQRFTEAKSRVEHQPRARMPAASQAATRSLR